MARTMLMDSKLKDIFWTHAVHTIVHIQKGVMVINNNAKNPYKLWNGKPTNVKHFRVFGSKCYIKREDGRMGKFDSRVEKVILVGPLTVKALTGRHFADCVILEVWLENPFLFVE